MKTINTNIVPENAWPLWAVKFARLPLHILYFLSYFYFQLLGHLDEMLDAAFTKFMSWQNKRMMKRS